MRVAVHEHILWIKRQECLWLRGAQLVTMAYMQRYSVNARDDLLLQTWNTRWVRVAEHCGHRSDQAQLVEHFGTADVARVEYQLHARERGVHAGPHQPVGIGYEPNQAFGPALAHFCIMQTMSWTRLTGQLALRSLRKPSLIPALFTVAWRFRRREWYRRAPFLPLPARDYLKWRMYTAYGDADAVPPARDVERYALWTVGRS